MFQNVYISFEKEIQDNLNLPTMDASNVHVTNLINAYRFYFSLIVSALIKSYFYKKHD